MVMAQSELPPSHIRQDLDFNRVQIDVLHVIVLHKLIHYELFYGTDIRRSNKEGR